MIDDNFIVEERDVYCSECDEVIEMSVTVFCDNTGHFLDVICPECGTFIELEEE